MHKLIVRGLKKSYKKREVIKGVDFEISSGESVAILGPNGAGKTTCFYMIVGIVRPDEGKVMLDGEEITNLPIHIRARLGISYLPQEPSIFRGLSVEENIMAGLEYSCKNKEERVAKLDELLNEFKISHLRKSLSISLSGGERRRLEIARCLATKPNFVLLDEPFAGVDPVSVADVISIVSHLKERGIGVLITDHNVRETLKIADRGYIIYNGKVLVSGNAKEITSNEEAKKYYLGENFI
jgi:lipopolysaccharide export system ATP-binding protein